MPIIPSTRQHVRECMMRLGPRHALPYLRRPLVVLAAPALSLLLVAPVAAREPVARCSIAKWNTAAEQADGTLKMVSGGCTCYVAERIGRPIPWDGDAEYWYSNPTWPKRPTEPRAGAIAAFASGHVAYVESVTLEKTDRMQLTPNAWAIFETYRVTVAQRDYYADELGVFRSSWQARKMYMLVNGKATTPAWQTVPGSAVGLRSNLARLQGYIYRP